MGSPQKMKEGESILALVVSKSVEGESLLGLIDRWPVTKLMVDVWERPFRFEPQNFKKRPWPVLASGTMAKINDTLRPAPFPTEGKLKQKLDARVSCSWCRG